MKTVALRFGEQFSPECGTIAAHQKLIDEIGYVWYGKIGRALSKKFINELAKDSGLKILLISSKKINCFLADVLEVREDIPPLNEIPEYYRNIAYNFGTWFKITKFEQVSTDIMEQCRVISSGRNLKDASKHSINPCFNIDFEVKIE